MINGLRFSGQCFLIAFFLYCVAFVIYTMAVIATKSDETSDIKKKTKLSFVIALLGLACHFLYFFTRWYAVHIPVSNMYEFMSCLAMMVMIAFIVLYTLYQNYMLGLVCVGLTVLLMAYAAVFPNQVQPLIPSLQSVWLKIHVTLAALGEAFFAVGFAAAFMHLLATVDFKDEAKGSRTPKIAIELTLIALLTVTGFISTVFTFRAIGYEVLFVQQKQASSSNEPSVAQSEVTYRMPPIIIPYQSHRTNDSMGSEFDHYSLQAPAWMSSGHAARKCNTVVWSFLTGLGTYVVLRLLFRRPLGEKLHPMFKTMNAQDLDEISYRSIAIGFPIFTLGALIFAMVWAQIAWGRFWAWDPKEVWALITWLYYVVYLHLRLSKGWYGTKSSCLAVFGFLIVMFTLVGVNLVIAGLHSYAGTD